MATQKCPKCKSNRIRPGYRRTGIFSKLIFRYNLLCNNCNLEFVGFAIPGTLSNKAKKAKKKYPDPNFRPPKELEKNKSDDNESEFVSAPPLNELKDSESLDLARRRIKKRVKVRF